MLLTDRHAPVAEAHILQKLSKEPKPLAQIRKKVAKVMVTVKGQGWQTALDDKADVKLISHLPFLHVVHLSIL